MANFFYFDQVNQKQGPVSAQQLKELATQGVIGPNTPMESDTGHKGLAGQIPGLFPTAASPPAQPVQVPLVVAPPQPSINLFCTNCGNSVSDKAVACMSCGARPTGHKKFCRQCGVGLNPEQVVCVKCGAALTGNFGAGATAAATATMANLKSIFQATGAAFARGSGTGGTATAKSAPVTSVPTPRTTNVPIAKVPLDAQQRKARIHFWTILCVISCVIYLAVSSGWVLYALDAVFPGTTEHILEQQESDDISLLEAVVAFTFYLSGIAYLVCYYFYLRRLWDEIPGEFARTTPKKAALFMLIPFWNWYWQFVAFLGLYNGMNETTESYGLGSRFERSLIEVVCVGWIPINIAGLIYGIYVGMSPDSLDWLTTGNEVVDTSILVLVPIVGAIVTVFVYWIIRKDVLEFIDIKTSMGR